MTTDNNRPYVLWRRVSTKEQGTSGLGLEAQKTIAEYFMRSEASAIFTDVYSGTKLNECTELRKAIAYCKSTGYMLVIAKTDRFRNVQQALAILDEVGEGNLFFCDLPTTDRTVLTIVFAIWERQALMGRINTKRALDERIKERDRNGCWISKAGNVCTHLGREKGCDMSAASAASAASRTNSAIAWREQSQAVKVARRKRAEGWTLQMIVDEISQLFDENRTNDPDTLNPYATPNGCKPSCGTISKWLRGSNQNTLAM